MPDLFELFDDSPPVYKVQTWQYAKYDRVAGVAGRWDTIEEAVAAASKSTKVAESEFQDADPDDDLTTLAADAYETKRDLVVVFRESSGNIVRVATLPEGFQPDASGV